jgi:hypothetical protein
VGIFIGSLFGIFFPNSVFMHLFMQLEVLAGQGKGSDGIADEGLVFNFRHFHKRLLEEFAWNGSPNL